jgi:hypothetical protein
VVLDDPATQFVNNFFNSSRGGSNDGNPYVEASMRLVNFKECDLMYGFGYVDVDVVYGKLYMLI